MSKNVVLCEDYSPTKPHLKHVNKTFQNTLMWLCQVFYLYMNEQNFFIKKTTTGLFVSISKPTGITKEDAMAAYVDLVEKLKVKCGI